MQILRTRTKGAVHKLRNAYLTYLPTPYDLAEPKDTPIPLMALRNL